MSKTLFLALAISSVSFMASAGDLDIADNGWNITFNNSNNTLTYEQNGNKLFTGAYLTATCGDDTQLSSKDYPTVDLSSENITDGYGSGKKYTDTYPGLTGKGKLVQNIYVYPSQPYILIDGAVEGQPGNPGAYRICPLVCQSTVTLPLPGNNNRTYDMPFANDNWATFNTSWVTQPQTSCEASAFFNVDNRNGIVVGSVDHSVWKSGVEFTPNGTNRLRNFSLTAGYVSARTWDTVSGKSSVTRHGTVKGERVVSPRFMLGFFDDWRNGLETYGEANTVVCPKLEWTKDDSLFGWQSWGGMEFGLNYTSAMSVLEFFEKELLPLGFYNQQGRCMMVLDSGWDALNDDQLRKYAEKCKSLGIAAGIYTTPFSYWGSESDCINNNEWEGGRLGELVLKGNGRYRQISAMSLDPTHPVVKEWNRKRFQKFRDLGFEFVKIDFMNNGSQEADKFYLPEITTGMQAYNYGMDYIMEFAGDMMIDFSIAPVFPAKAHVRRIGCDAWGDLPQSMYTLNCINGSWWLDRCYTFNDPDHMCVSRVAFNQKGSNDIQEARIRYTCGLMCGMTLLGGTYAYEGDTKKINDQWVHMVGTDEERARVVEFAKNKNLTEMGRIGRTFRPVEGTFSHFGSLWANNDTPVDNEFILDTDKAFYYVVFNYGTQSNDAINEAPDFNRLGINAADYTNVTELWTGETAAPTTLKINVPKKDVRIYRFEKPGYGETNGIENPEIAATTVAISGGTLRVSAPEAISNVNVYNTCGMLLKSQNLSDGECDLTMDAPSTELAIVKVIYRSGTTTVHKVACR